MLRRKSTNRDGEISLCSLDGIEVTALAWLPQQRKIAFATTDNRGGWHPFSPKASSRIGFYNPATDAMGSFITDPCPRVSRMLSWRDGILLCTPIGLLFLNLTSGQILSYTKGRIPETYVVTDVSAASTDSVWLIAGPQNGAKAELFHLDLRRSICLRKVVIDNHEPACVVSTPIGKHCYSFSRNHDYISHHHVDKEHNLMDSHRLTYISLRDVSALKLGPGGILIVAARNELVLFSKHGSFIHRRVCRAKIEYFDVVDEYLVMQDEKRLYAIEIRKIVSKIPNVA